MAIELDDLVAETSYTIFLYLVDRGNNNVGPQTLSFKTLDRYNAADFTLQFTQDSLNAAEVQVSINTVAFLLSLDTAKVQQRKYAFSRRLLAEEEDYQSEDQDSRQLQLAGSTIIHLQIIAIPNSTYFPSPYELALLLNSKISDLNDKLNNYDTTYTITASNFTRYVPAYSGQPSWDAVGYQWSTFKGALNNYGFIYVVVVPTIDDTGIPSAYQIWRGYTNQNIPTYSGYVEVSTASTQFTINITGLTETTAYNAYIIGGSVHPGYPDLMADSSVVKVNFTTDTPPIVYNVTTPDSANMMAGVSTALIGFIYVILIA